jgi:hypothetical protein
MQANVFGAFCSGAIAGSIISLYVLRAKSTRGVALLEQPLAYTDTVVIVLTCVTVIITCAALVIGMLGIFGYQKLKHDASQEAISMALSRMEQEISDGGTLRKLLVERSDEFIATYNRRRPGIEEWGNEETDHGE